MKFIWYILVFFGLVLIYIGYNDFELHNNVPHITFLKVGQGDAIFVELPDNTRILIDAGPDRQVIYELSKFLDYKEETIDYVILTHPHKDHYMGTGEILDRFKVKHIIWTGKESKDKAFTELKTKIKSQNIKTDELYANDKLRFSPECYIKILWPFKENLSFENYNTNNTSLVFTLKCLNYSALFTGDITQEVESKILQKYENLNATILKIPHHGSKKSSSYEFLQEVDPELGVVTVGENNFDQPNQEVLDKLKLLDIRFISTFKQGNINIRGGGIDK